MYCSEWKLHALFSEGVYRISKYLICDSLAQIRVQRNFDFYYRDVPNPANCTVDTLPPPSDPVAIETMEIKEFSLLGKMMNLTMQWALPEDTFGMIGKSEIRVTALLQLSEQEIVNDTDLIIHRIINVRV